MIAVDTNILVYAHRQDSEWNEVAYECVQGLAVGRARWAIPWPCVHEFLAVVTHPHIYDPPSTTEDALNQVDGWLGSPTVTFLGEGERYIDLLREMLTTGHIQGPRVHDARIAALCTFHGVRELWSADRDFSRFPQLRTRNPLAKK